MTQRPRAPLEPALHRIVQRVEELPGTTTLTLMPVEERDRLASPCPGQFAMLWSFGVGEVPISFASVGSRGELRHTVRAVGPVTSQLANAEPGDLVGARGPYGTGWNFEDLRGFDLILIGGGLGLAPLRPAIEVIGARRDEFNNVVLLAGARSPSEFLYIGELGKLCRDAQIEFRPTVDHLPSVDDLARWHGHVGVVTELIADAVAQPGRTKALICGPEIMMRYAARELCSAGVDAAAIQLSLERNMHCGIGICGHCQLGPLLICRDGPVITYDVVREWLEVTEL
ncbi:MAG: FAD/NAD(P)-binding protein [Acidimicrobiales bacterium]|nr:FAD/NAD(P)-binding protein [Acidimicrobiales bacterium]